MRTLHPTHPELPMPRESAGTRPQGAPTRRARLSEIEFFERQPSESPPAVFDAFDEWSVPVRARLLDPRLQKVISAAANGWVVERY